MAVTVGTVIEGPFTPNGATVAFPFTFKAVTPSEVEVRQEQGGALVVLDPSLYTITVDSGEGGSATFGVAPASGSGSIYLFSAPNFTASSAFSAEGPFSPKVLNSLFDRAAVRDLVLKEGLDRALQVPLGEAGLSLPAAAARASKFIGFDADGALVAANALVGVPAVASNIESDGPSDLQADIYRLAGAAQVNPNAFFAYDDFRTDRLLNGSVAPTGQTWNVGSDGAATFAVVNGQMVSGGLNGYPSLVAGDQIEALGGVVAYSRTAVTAPSETGPQCTLIAQTGDLGLVNMLHIQFFSGTMSAEVRKSGTIVGSIAGTTLTVTAVSGAYLTEGPAPTLGAQISGEGVTTCVVLDQLSGTTGGVGTYEVSVSQTVSSRTMTANGAFDGLASTTFWLPDNVPAAVRLDIDKPNSRCRVTSPLGLDSGWLTDPRIGMMDLTAGTWQIQSTEAGAAREAAWQNVWISGGNLSVPPAVAQGAVPTEILPVLLGPSFSTHADMSFTASASSFYRIAEAALLANYGLVGRIVLLARQDGGGWYKGEWVVEARGGTPPRLKPIMTQTFGLPLVSLRLSTSGSACVLDLEVDGGANPVDVWIGYREAAFTRPNFGVPQPGATALTNVATASLADPQVTEISGVATTNDYYTIAEQSALAAPGAGVIYGGVIVEAITANSATASYYVIDFDQWSGDALKEPHTIALAGNGAISGFRISRAALQLRVSANCNGASSDVRLKVRSFGHIGLPASIAVEAAPLGTESKTFAPFVTTKMAAVADPTGGATVDTECRAQLASLLAKLRTSNRLVAS